MSMFDSIKCEMLINGKDVQDIDYQTKSLDSCMNNYTIDETGKLWKLHYELVEDKKLAKKKGILAFVGRWKRINEHYEKYYFHGTIHFYNYRDYNKPENYVDYVAIYNEGEFVGIYNATENGMRIYKDIYNTEFLAVHEIASHESEFVQRYSAHLENFITERKTNKLLEFFGITKDKLVRGIPYFLYKGYKQIKETEFQEYIDEHPIKAFTTVVKKPKKKVKK
jgi:hypothetical protein